MAGTEKLVQIGVDMGYFLSGNNHVEQNALVSGKLCIKIESVSLYNSSSKFRHLNCCEKVLYH